MLPSLRDQSSAGSEMYLIYFNLGQYLLLRHFCEIHFVFKNLLFGYNTVRSFRRANKTAFVKKFSQKPQDIMRHVLELACGRPLDRSVDKCVGWFCFRQA
jgi:hypothetical protein